MHACAYVDVCLYMKLQFLEMPSIGCVHQPMLFQYTVYNRTRQVQQVEAVMESSETFMLAGNNQVFIINNNLSIKLARSPGFISERRRLNLFKLQQISRTCCSVRSQFKCTKCHNFRNNDQVDLVLVPNDVEFPLAFKIYSYLRRVYYFRLFYYSIVLLFGQ